MSRQSFLNSAHTDYTLEETITHDINESDYGIDIIHGYNEYNSNT